MWDAGLSPKFLEVWEITKYALSIYFRRIHVFILLALFPALIVQFALAEAYTPLFELAKRLQALVSPGDEARAANDAIYMIVGTTGFLTMLVSGAFMMVMALDAASGRATRVLESFRRGLAVVGVVVLSALLLTVVTGLVGLAAALIGHWGAVAAMPASGLVSQAVGSLFTLWISSATFIFLPVAVIERAGLRAIPRSLHLTKGYRWPIALTFVLSAICAFVIGMLVQTAISMISLPIISFLVAPELRLAAWLQFTAGPVGFAIVSAISLGPIHAAIALIYARLRKIKEGVGSETLTEAPA